MPGIKALADLVAGACFLLHPHVAETGPERHSGLFYKGFNVTPGSFHAPHLQRASPRGREHSDHSTHRWAWMSFRGQPLSVELAHALLTTCSGFPALTPTALLPWTGTPASPHPCQCEFCAIRAIVLLLSESLFFVLNKVFPHTGGMLRILNAWGSNSSGSTPSSRTLPLYRCASAWNVPPAPSPSPSSRAETWRTLSHSSHLPSETDITLEILHLIPIHSFHIRAFLLQHNI